jgi:LysM repeat protein
MSGFKFSFMLVILAIAVASSAVSFAQNNTPAFEGEITYTVQVADTLDTIGARFDVKVECIGELNNLDNINRIFPGDELIISDTCPRYGGDNVVSNPRSDASPAFGLQTGVGASGQGGGGDQVWVVGIGDTLDTIGQTLNVSVVALQVANEIEPSQALRVNQRIVIPADAPAYGLFPALTEPPGDGQGGGGGGEVYVVQPRDTLDLIGARLNVQVACVAEANEIVNVNRIFPGQALLIPDACPEYDGGSSP